VEQASDISTLWRCLDCRFQFKHPIPSVESLLKGYQNLGSEDRWDHGVRTVWSDLKKRLPPAGGSILDIGCFTGDFLSWLDPRWGKFGVEPSPSAALRAEQRGARVVAREIADLQELRQEFDAVTLIDVLEHIPYPVSALETVLSVVAPGGKVIIVTGDTSSLSWRFSGANYWYAALPEHVSFFRPAWFRGMARQLGYRVLSSARCAHRPGRPPTRLDQAAKAALFRAYEFMPGPIRRRRPMSAVQSWGVPWWTAATDHLLIELEKD
jgi:2-polyprenyl-3-methyl-5-hydroxy-6-metoxy-1,4-benzoquinol methylase